MIVALSQSASLDLVHVVWSGIKVVTQILIESVEIGWGEPACLLVLVATAMISLS